MTGTASGHEESGHDGDHQHRSRWPIVATVGAALLYVGFGGFALARSTGLLPPTVLLGVAGLGAVVIVVGLFGWLHEAFLTERVAGDSKPLYTRTMRLFVYSDVATFAAGFIVYFYLRVATWPPAELPHLLSLVVGVNTALLLASSGTFHLAVSALHDGNDDRFRALVGATLLLAVVFLGGQVYEYRTLLAEGFVPTESTFAAAFYGLTGLHGLHVALGALLIGIVLLRALRGEYAPDRDTSVETVELYWHFVDLVWVFLVLAVYVGASL